MLEMKQNLCEIEKSSHTTKIANQTEFLTEKSSTKLVSTYFLDNRRTFYMRPPFENDWTCSFFFLIRYVLVLYLVGHVSYSQPGKKLLDEVLFILCIFLLTLCFAHSCAGIFFSLCSHQYQVSLLAFIL